jgi:hypothetical protein
VFVVFSFNSFNNSSNLDAAPFPLALNLFIRRTSTTPHLFAMSDPEKRGQEPAILGLVQLPIPTSEDVSEEEATTKEAAAKVMKSVHDENAEHLSELQPHLHARTFLAVFAVCLIYFVQLFSIVGAGTVSFVFLCEHRPQRKVQLQEVTQLLILVPR